MKIAGNIYFISFSTFVRFCQKHSQFATMSYSSQIITGAVQCFCLIYFDLHCRRFQELSVCIAHIWSHEPHVSGPGMRWVKLLANIEKLGTKKDTLYTINGCGAGEITIATIDLYVLRQLTNTFFVITVNKCRYTISILKFLCC